MSTSEKLNKDQVETILALSPPQEGMLFHYLSDPSKHVEQLTFRLNNCGHNVRQAWETVTKANQALRTVFRWEGLEAPIQIILKDQKLSYSEYDLTSESPEQQEVLLKSYRATQREKEFDLQLHSFRVLLCRLSEDEIEMTLTYHHIIMDGWSTGVLLREFVYVYQALNEGKEVHLLPKTSYKAFVLWHQEKSHENKTDYWQGVLSDFEWKPGISSRNLMPEGSSKAEKKEHATFRNRPSDHIYAAVRKIAERLKTTPATFFYAAWAFVLQRYGNTEDIVFGTAVSGRKATIVGIDQMVGLFSSVIPLRVRTATKKDCVRELLLRIDASLKEREPFEHVPLADIQQVGQVPPGMSLFDSIVVIENYPLDHTVLAQSTLRLTETFKQMTYPLVLIVYPFEQLEFELQFHSQTLEQAEALMNRYIHILEEITFDEEQLISELGLLSKSELNQMESWQGAMTADQMTDRTVFDAFEWQAEREPDRIAVSFGERSLTYGELNDRADRLAHLLRSKGVIPDQLVAIMLERSIEMMVGLLAILKAGGAYVPIDPSYPKDRIAYLLEDSQAHLLLTDGRQTPSFSGEIIDLTDESYYEDIQSKVQAVSGSCNLAYVIYTSGSTGKPKGVMVEHHSIVNRLEWMQKCYPLTKADVILQKTSFSFDVSVWELFWWGMSGASVVFLEPGEEKNPAAIVQAVKQYGVTVMHFVPSMLQLFLDHVEDNRQEENLRSLHHIFVSGEALRVQQAYRFKHLFEQVKLVNLYGPTEATVDVSFHECSGDSRLSTIPIGRPIDNTSLYIMNQHMQQQPVGAVGELYIGGIGVARGYWGRPELTAEKFISNPFKSEERIYKTGDLARRLPNGEIDYLGRTDYQVKIRGYRIERGEIEHVLANHPAVLHAIVVVKQLGESDSLVAYVQLHGGEQRLDEVKTHAASILAPYMIPSLYVVLEQLPLTSNQKIDLKNLPEPDSYRSSRSPYTPARNDVEHKLVNIWRDVLNIEQIGITDHFFELGGNSILLMRLYNKCRKEISDTLLITDLFAYPTIRQLAEFVSQHGDGHSRSKRKGIHLETGLTGRARGKVKPGGLEAIIDGELLKFLRTIADMEQTSTDAILLAMFLYQLSEYAVTSTVEFDMMFSSYNEVASAQISMDGFQSFSPLFYEVNQQISSNFETYSIENWKDWEQDSNGTHLLVSRRELLTSPINLLDVYDIVFRIADGKEASMRLTVDFNIAFLREDRIESLVGEYLESLHLLVAHFQKIHSAF